MPDSPPRDPRVMAILAEVLARPAGERDEYVHGACLGDQPLLHAVAEAMEQQARVGVFLDKAAVSAAPTISLGETSVCGTAIGPYRLLEKIGEGGMAEVWRGEQTTPVHRTVAIKLIKTGMETRAMIARFESERQALALMEHPAIARVFDAGATLDGRPYFVMEYVPGMPITQYCDKHRLLTRERLQLFMQVCEGVQHAHQKAIIHRDLKPSNVLVSLQDGKPVIKIIDFGLAKALAQRLTEKTMLTEMGVLVGTPEYMSPEQAELTGHNIDTRTDVYSLGLILYELLVGALPFDSRELRQAGFAEMLRRIREEDPPRPSTRLRTLGDSLAESARNRKTEPGMLARQLEADLDWIAMKALEKDQTRRYGSPSDLAAEIGRYLRDEPVLASPPSVVYRAGKFARRHRAGVGMAAGLLLLLLGVAITTTVQARRFARERDRASREAEVSRRVQDFLTGLFQVSAPSEARGNSITAREILDKGARQIDAELSAQPEIQAQLMYTMGNAYRSLGLFSQAQPLLERALETRRRVLGPEHRETLRSTTAVADLFRNQARMEEAERLLRAELVVMRRALGSDDVETFRATNILARLLGSPNRSPDEALKLMEDSLPRERRALGPEHEVTLDATVNLAVAYQAKGRITEAGTLFRDVVAGRRRVLGLEHPLTLLGMYAVAEHVSFFEHHYQEGESLFRDVLETQLRILGPEHPATLSTMFDLGLLYYDEHRYADAERVDREALTLARKVPLNDLALKISVNLGNLYAVQQRYTEAERVDRDALAFVRQAPFIEPGGATGQSSSPYAPDRYRDAALLFYNLACLAAVQNRGEEALANLRQAVDHGYRTTAEMANDADLKSLHGDPRFDAILAELKRLAAEK